MSLQTTAENRQWLCRQMDRQRDRHTYRETKCNCGKEIIEETKALQCDKYGHETAWKCITCVGITPELYDMLTVEDGPELKWFCESCLHSPASCPPIRDNHDKLEETVATLRKLMDKLCHIENHLDNKADVPAGRRWNENESSRIKDRQHWGENPRNKAEQKNGWNSYDRRRSLKSKEEVKCTVIIHGLPESGASEASERQEDDLGLIASMLHEMKCDNVEAVQTLDLDENRRLMTILMHTSRDPSN